MLCGENELEAEAGGLVLEAFGLAGRGDFEDGAFIVRLAALDRAVEDPGQLVRDGHDALRLAQPGVQSPEPMAPVATWCTSDRVPGVRFGNPDRIQAMQPGVGAGRLPRVTPPDRVQPGMGCGTKVSFRQACGAACGWLSATTSPGQWDGGDEPTANKAGGATPVFPGGLADSVLRVVAIREDRDHRDTEAQRKERPFLQPFSAPLYLCASVVRSSGDRGATPRVRSGRQHPGRKTGNGEFCPGSTPQGSPCRATLGFIAKILSGFPGSPF